MKKYILIEGIDGSGKSTTADILETSFRTRGLSVRRVYEPGTTEIGKKLRAMALNDPEPRSFLTEMFLFLGARSHLMDELAKDDCDTIISDRGWPSTWVFQVKDDKTQVLYDRTVNLLRPDVPIATILLTCSYDTYIARRGEKREGSDNIEKRLKDREAFDEIQQRYIDLPGGYDLVLSTDDTSPTDIVGEIVKWLTQ